ncbi:MAG: ABC transporter ATP-binding protein [Defluviitaleaceae bacterium]|nr:ABC transporter ATP-binding protein [Defluviitaleaceae bacterium]MCL2273877.1 ABC transporter ATP-binding protein [Defluviitaleaceae bacterium]
MSNALLKAENLSIAFGGLKAVDDLSFEMNEGEIYGIIGPNGAGKTTAFNCITQFYRPDAGKVLFNAKEKGMIDLVGKKPHDIIGLGLVRTFQNVELIVSLSVIENLLVGAHTAFKSSLFSQILKLPKARREEEVLRKRAEAVLESLNLLHLKDMPALMQPYGIQKRIELGRTLMLNPKLIILDEPAAGLNDVETQALVQTVKDISSQYKCGILLIEHDMNFVSNVCQRICAINFGKLLAIGTPEEIKVNHDVQEAYLGKDEA